MFLTVHSFKKLITQAFQAGRLTIGRHEDKLLFEGPGWSMEVERCVFPNKALGSVIELTGEIPADGELFVATKQTPIQYLVPITYREVMKEVQEATHLYHITDVIIKCGTMSARVLQSEGQNIQVINDFIIQAIDANEMDFAYENYLTGPSVKGDDINLAYWRSECCALAVSLGKKENMNAADLLTYLEGFNLTEKQGD